MEEETAKIWKLESRGMNDTDSADLESQILFADSGKS
jgi:hypothetical protein